MKFIILYLVLKAADLAEDDRDSSWGTMRGKCVCF